MNLKMGPQILAGMLLIAIATQLIAGENFIDSKETVFMEGGDITIQLSAGEHEIVQSEDDTIRVSWYARSADRDDVKASTSVDGGHAMIRLDGPRKKFRTLIEIPRHSDVSVRLTAGDLNVHDVEGDMDIRLRAGDLSIEVGDSSDYAHVEGSLWAGDISAGPFDEEASGLFRSIEWQGRGERDLRFKLYAGDVTIYQGAD